MGIRIISSRRGNIQLSMSSDRRFSRFSIEDNRVPILFNTVVLNKETADDKEKEYLNTLFLEESLYNIFYHFFISFCLKFGIPFIQNLDYIFVCLLFLFFIFFLILFSFSSSPLLYILICSIIISKFSLLFNLFECW